MAVLRSMEQAVYSPQHVGHFALASRWYCHFTSPIRRYPDLTIHRLIDRYLAGELGKKKRPDAMGVPDERAVTEVGDHCSFTERRAADAEREAKTVKVLELLSDRIGEAFDGVVTGVTNVGVFVQLIRYGVDGLIRFNDLPDDWWDIDVKQASAVGERTGLRITLGDLVKVDVVSVNVPARQLDLSLAEPPRRSAKQPKEETPPKRGRHAKRKGKSKSGKRAEKKTHRKGSRRKQR
jgi:ribonuclease R